MPAPARWNVGEAADAIGAVVRDLPDGGARARTLGPARNDARDVQPGDLFVALQGTRTHGLEFARDACQRGAAAVLVGNDATTSARANVPAELPVLEVRESTGLEAVGRLARAWRKRNAFLVVGITGSTGKTSTKDLLAALVGAHRRTVASLENHNNELGVPLTLLGAEPDTQIVICEMGMRGLGQVRYLCDIAEPDVGIVTNAAAAHIELLGSEQNIVRAKAELVAGVGDGGVAIVPLAQPELVEAAAQRPQRLLAFGDGEALRAADDRFLSGVDGCCVARELRRTETGIEVTLEWHGGDAPRGFVQPLQVALPLFGAHQARNLAAATAALAALTGDVEGPAEAVLALRISRGRGDRYPLRGDGVLIDDAYNANPVSMQAALDELVDTPGERHVAVLGAMAELGEHAPRYHHELGLAAARAELDELVVVATTPDSRAIVAAYEQQTGTPAVTFGSVEEALAHTDDWLRDGDVVLVKASNSVGLGALAQALARAAAPGNQATDAAALAGRGDGA